MTALCPWMETVLYRFRGGNDGGFPSYGGLAFDEAGNLYGTTDEGGLYGYGAVFELTPTNGGWTESTIYSFTGGQDGGDPSAGVIFDKEGNLYGATQGAGYGTIFELTPSSTGWTETTIYSFANGNDGRNPASTLISDASGNFYGSTLYGGQNQGGTVFELTRSGGSWSFQVLYSLVGIRGPIGVLAMDAAGNIFGATNEGGIYEFGSAFELSPSNGQWTYTSLHDFTGRNDGGYVVGGVTLDSNGNLYGTASEGGQYNGGVIWQVTPN